MFRVLRVILVVLLVFVQSIQAKDTANTFKHFRVLLKNGVRYEGSEGRLIESSLVGKMKIGESMTIPREDIRALDVSVGSNAGKYAAIGAGIGLLTSLTAILAASAAAETSYLLTASLSSIFVGFIMPSFTIVTDDGSGAFASQL